MSLIQRAYSLFEVKSIDEEQRTIQGVASTPSPDRMDDIVEPMGAVFKLPMPLLWMHDSRMPVGHVIAAKPTKSGIPITAQFARVDGPPSLVDDLERAWAMVKSRLVSGLSIGFNALESTDIEGSRWGRRFTKWEWLELSAVTVPANSDCSITAIKSADQAARRAASGAQAGSRIVRLDPEALKASAPGASGPQARRPGVVYLK